jgi:uncharacterized protein (UPF0332 family)
MTIKDDDRNSLIHYRLEQTNETINDVQILIDNDRYRAAVNRIYYGMFYSLLALGLAYQFETSKHSQLIGWFNKNFIHKGLIEPQYGRYINQAFNARSKGDYDLYVDFEKDDVVEMFGEMKEFISRIKQYLEID